MCNTLSSENERSPKIKCFYCSILFNQFDLDSVIPDISSRINYHMFHTFFMPQQLHCSLLCFQTKGSIRKVPENVFWKLHGSKTVRCFTPQIVCSSLGVSSCTMSCFKGTRTSIRCCFSFWMIVIGTSVWSTWIGVLIPVLRFCILRWQWVALGLVLLRMDMLLWYFWFVPPNL